MISIATIYFTGEYEEETMQLREKSEASGRKGRLKTQVLDGGEEWAPFLYDSEGNKKPEFSLIPDPDGLKHIIAMNPETMDAKQQSIFAFGGRRANLNPNIVDSQ